MVYVQGDLVGVGGSILLPQKKTDQFNPVKDHVYRTYTTTSASGAAHIIIHQDKVASEHYWGTHSALNGARKIQEDSQFHVASVRKSYIGFAVAYAVYLGFISSIDAPVTDYLPDLDDKFMRGITIRHLLTHSHGLKSKKGKIEREFQPGKSWAYRGLGIDMLCDIVHKATGKTISHILTEYVFDPLGFTQTGWYASPREGLVDVIRDPNDPLWATFDSVHGDRMNMYVSTRELALWGYFHLSGGNLFGKQHVPKEVIDLATSIQSPVLQEQEFPQNGFLWFVKDLPAKLHEIGDDVPQGSYQILGYTGVTLLVIPKYETVAVRMFNSWGSPSGYDYLEDVRSFGDCVVQCLQ